MPAPKKLLTREVRAEAIDRFKFNDRVFHDVADAFDHMVAGETEEFMARMADANAAMGFQGEIPESEKPTAVDKSLAVCLHVYCVNNHLGKHPEQQKRVMAELKRRCELT